MFNTPRAGLTLEVPKPMHVFKERVVHPDNEQLILAAQDARLLTKAKLKLYQQRGQALKIALGALGYDRINADLEAIKVAYHDYRAAVHDLRLSKKGLEHLEAWVIDLQIEQLREANQELIQQYKTLMTTLTQPRKPTTLTLTWRDKFSPVKRLAKDLIAGEFPLRKLARQLELIRQRLAEHKDAVQQQKQREILFKEMAKEARIFAKIIQRRWAGLGFCHRYSVVKNGVPKTITRHVRFSRIEVTEDQIFLKIDVTSLGLFGETHNNMPTGVAVGKLLAPDVMDDLTVACQRQVTTPHLEENANWINGAWVIVNRLGSTDGLMNYIEFKPVMATYKREWHEELPFPMGVKQGRIVNWIRLTQQPHLMVTGQTGSGKSNVFNTFIVTAVSMHSPDEIRLILCDLKEGVGFLKYQDLPHVLGGKVLTELEHLDETLQRLEKLRYQRTVQIRAIADNIDDYNRMVSPENRMTRIVLVIDEFQEAASAPKEQKERILKLVHKIAAKGRNVGIHLFLGTQIAYTKMMPGEIKGNITFVLSGRQRTMGASFATFGSKIATDIPKIPGRMICDDGNDAYQVQIPFVTGADIQEAMATAHTWDTPRPLELPPVEGSAITTFDDPRPLTVNEVVGYALACQEGVVKASVIYEQLGKERGIGQPTVSKLVKEITAHEQIEFGGQQYKPVKQRGNFYKLELIEPVAIDTSSE